uniref:SCP domain-containing protein n=1 Tax=Ciona savignyi TaxID=51511 RepID=H2YDM6_CIOSA
MKLSIIFVLLSVIALTYCGNRPKRGVKKAIELTHEEHMYYVDMHNAKRSEVEPAASNMQRMFWDKELADISEKHSRTCIDKHSSRESRQNEKYSSAGENLFAISPEVPVKVVLEHSLKGWFNEKRFYTLDTNGCTGVCGHYTQVTWAQSVAVGCGVTTCENFDLGGKVQDVGMFVVCTYGPAGNVVGSKPYLAGTACSDCPATHSNCTENLCSIPGAGHSHSGGSSEIFRFPALFLSLAAMTVVQLV